MSESSPVAVAKSDVSAQGKVGERLAWAFPLLLLLPATVLMLALYAWPFISSVYRSFLTKDSTVTLANYEKAFELYFRDVVFSLEVAILGTLIAALFYQIQLFTSVPACGSLFLLDCYGAVCYGTGRNERGQIFGVCGGDNHGRPWRDS